MTIGDRVRIVREWRRADGRRMTFDTLCGYVTDVKTHQSGGRTLVLRIPIWSAPHEMLRVPASCCVAAPLGERALVTS
jgi:hypothetical protein